MNKTIVLIDAGFLSKLNKHLGDGKYLRYVQLTKEDFYNAKLSNLQEKT